MYGNQWQQYILGQQTCLVEKESEFSGTQGLVPSYGRVLGPVILLFLRIICLFYLLYVSQMARIWIYFHCGILSFCTVPGTQ